MKYGFGRIFSGLNVMFRPQMIVYMDRLNDKIMPIHEDEWNAGRINHHYQLDHIIIKILELKPVAYTRDEILGVMLSVDDDLPDSLKDDLKTLNVDARWPSENGQQKDIVNKVAHQLVEDGKIETKLIKSGTSLDVIPYFKAKST